MDQTKFNNLLSIMVFVDTTRINKLMCNPESQPYLDETLSWDQTVRDAIQSIRINKKFINKTEKLIPGILIKKISSPYESMKNEKIKKSFESNSPYTNKIVERQVEYFKTINVLKIPEENIVALSISSVLTFKNLSSFNLMFKTLNLNEQEVRNILGAKYQHFLQEVNKKYNPSNFFNIFEIKSKIIPTLTQQIKFLIEEDSKEQYRLLFALEFTKKLQTNNSLAKTYLQNLILDLSSQNFPASIFANELLWKTKNLNYLNINNGINKIFTDLSKIKEDVMIEYLQDKNISNPSIKYDIFNLSLDGYWDLFQLDPVLVKDILQERFLLDDITFCDYKYDCWDFLNSLNPQVQSNIKTKIYTDMNFQMENRYGNIATLEDLVDVIIFCQAPPKFLELGGIPELYSEARNLLTNFLKSIKWDINKLNYLNWKLEVNYKLTQN